MILHGIRIICVLWLLTCLSAGVATSAPARISGRSNSGDPVELRLWVIPSKASSSPLEIANRRIFDAFCTEHPEIKVRALSPMKIESSTVEGGGEFLAVAGGVAPDVFYLFGRKVGDYRAQGFLYPLNGYLGDYAARTGRHYSGIAAPDKVWELCLDQGKIIAVPFTYYSVALQCDNGAFAKAGLAGRIPRDWDELYSFARHLTIDPSKEPKSRSGDKQQYGLQLRTGLTAGGQFLQYVWSGGGEVIQSYYSKDSELQRVPTPPVDYRNYGVKLSNESEYYAGLKKRQEDLSARGLPVDYSMNDVEWRLETNTPAAMRAFRFYRKLVHQPWLRNGDHEFDITPRMFKSRKAVDPITGDVFDLDDPSVRKRIYYGVTASVEEQAGTLQYGRINYAMWLGGLETVSAVDPTKYTTAPVPSLKGQPPAAMVAGHYLGVNAAIVPGNEPGRRDADAIRDAAWKYIEFVTGSKAQKLMVKTFAEFGLAEYVRASLLDDSGYGDIVARMPAARREIWENLDKHAHVEPYCEGFTHVMTRSLGMAIESLINDRPDPATGGYRRNLQQIMDDTVRTTNTMILGRMPETEVKRRSRIGWVVFAVMVLGLILGARQVVRIALRSQTRVSDNEGFGVGGHPARRRLHAWVFLVPALASVAVWAYYPLIKGLIMAFQDYKILGDSSYVGLRNFVEAVSEPKFWRYLLQTFQYTIMLVGLGFLAPIGLAVILTEIPRGKILYRTIYYLPAVTSGLVTLFLWKGLMYDPSNNGIVNQFILWFNSWPAWLAALARLALLFGFGAIGVSLLSQSFQVVNTKRERVATGVLGCGVFFGVGAYVISFLSNGGVSKVVQGVASKFDFSSQSFLTDPKLAMLWLVVPVIWATAGPSCLIYLAALKGIPEEQYEAADLDGAGIWHKLMNVTYPNLKALIIINFVGAVIAAFKESSNIFVMTGGGPEDATMTTGLYIWYNAFMFLNFGLATSMAWIMGALLIGFTLKQLQILNKIQFRNTAVESEVKGERA